MIALSFSLLYAEGLAYQCSDHQTTFQTQEGGACKCSQHHHIFFATPLSI